ncbi:MAG: GIY-YIG nuclease family protein [Acidobacteria bacterium]|nr:GIY-YIG nuclease family protein [Acidobacteriota bacterium]MBV9145345.1 GIY-YIG nuclease family protein [Acidobacteriota bacterium]MBV9435581.1 GIY-YIG nuclease family protein [Acidobacteriota bacterium]
MASKSRVLYTGITSNLRARVFEHKIGAFEGFTKRYRVKRLVYYESWKYVDSAIKREKQVKRWTRAQRVALVESMNPTWEDLASDWFSAERLANPYSVYLKYDPTAAQSFTTPVGSRLPLPEPRLEEPPRRAVRSGSSRVVTRLRKR